MVCRRKVVPGKVLSIICDDNAQLVRLVRPGEYPLKLTAIRRIMNILYEALIATYYTLERARGDRLPTGRLCRTVTK